MEKNKMATFQYKCRLCGKIYGDTHTSVKVAQIVLPCTILGLDMPKGYIGMQPDMVETHAGCKDGQGVSDLIGYVIEEG